MTSILTPAEIDSLLCSLPYATAGELVEMERLFAAEKLGQGSPMEFARVTSGGRYTTARHLWALQSAVTATLTGLKIKGQQRTEMEAAGIGKAALDSACRRLLVSMPPQHGKSEFCSRYLPAWYLGTNPNKRVILTSYEAEFASSWGAKARGLLQEHGGLFGVSVDQSSSAKDHWTIAGHDGGMMTAGCGGPITGKGADLLICDDLLKNHEEAHSKKIRDKAWDWLRSTAYTRLQPNAAVIAIGTRWHEDDPIGRLLVEMENGGEMWRVVKFPAVGNDGSALWPARFGLDELAVKRQFLGSYLWSALYQQEPIPDGGGMFKREWFEIVDTLPAGCQKAVRYWDKAGAEAGSSGDWSAAPRMTRRDGTYFIDDLVHGQWSPFARNEVMLQTAQRDDTDWGRRDLALWVEQEPGNGGKESAEVSTMQLARYGCRIDRPVTAKEVRARPFAAQCEAGNVKLVKGPWNNKLIDELCSFPHGAHDDIVDGCSGAFNKLAVDEDHKPGRGFAVGVSRYAGGPIR